MIIEFRELLSKRERKREINVTYDLKPLYYDGEKITAIEKVDVVGEVRATEDILVVTASAKTKLKLCCSRCLGTFIYPIDIDIEERFTMNKELIEDEQIIFVEGDSIDITEIVENSIISTLPIKRLCKNDCNGLCHQCGKNLNEASCQCTTNDVDLRLAKLQELFANKEV
ncbi:MAG: YceD family protein [Clostridium sp.]